MFRGSHNLHAVTEETNPVLVMCGEEQLTQIIINREGQRVQANKAQTIKNSSVHIIFSSNINKKYNLTI